MSVREKSGFSEEERSPIFPVCLVIDVSGSMSGPPINAVNETLPKLKQVLHDDPTTEEVARIAVVKFSDTGERVMELTDMREAQVPFLAATERMTNYAAALREARLAIEAGLKSQGSGTRFYKPVVFFISDGMPNVGGDWRPAFDELTDPSSNYRAEVVSFGMHEADRTVIQQLSTRHAFFAKDENVAMAVKAILNTIIGSIKTTSASFGGAGGSGGALNVPHDPDELTRLDVRTVGP